MKGLITNIFGSPRTTFAGLWATVMAPAMWELAPKVVAYFGAQPSIGWQIVGALLGFLVPALMPDKKPAQLTAAP